MSDEDFCALVHRLDERVAAVDGHGFATTPFDAQRRAERPARLLGGGRRLGEGRDRQRVRLAQGAAPVRRPDLARGGGAARLRGSVGAARSRHRELRQRGARRSRGRRRGRAAPARVRPRRRRPASCSRGSRSSVRQSPSVRAKQGVAGDPTVHRLEEALAGGALPFTCQGNLNGLAVEGGETLAWEMAATGAPVQRLVVQVGGGALASACIHGFAEAAALGAIAARAEDRHRPDPRRLAAEARLRPRGGARRRRRGGRVRRASPRRVHVALGTGAAQRRARHPRRRDVRLARRRRGHARHRRHAA